MQSITRAVMWWCSNGCATSEDILWKLEALQTFVCDLHWPDELFAEHINQRLQTMSNEMVEAAATRSVCIHINRCSLISASQLCGRQHFVYDVFVWRLR